MDGVNKIEVDVSMKAIRGHSELNVNDIQHNEVLNLSDEGERWEGDVMNNQPFGWGVLYDKEGEMAYEGFRIGNANVCYGTQYYADIGVIAYKGEWVEGKRWGKGIQYDREGKVVYDGDWLDDSNSLEKRVQITQGNEQKVLFHSFIEEIDIGSDCFNRIDVYTLDFSCFSFLKRLTFHSNSCQNILILTLNDLNHLTEVNIGNNTFNGAEGMFDLTRCSAIKELAIPATSFSWYTQCSIERNERLEQVTFGDSSDELYDDVCFANSSFRLVGNNE